MKKTLITLSVGALMSGAASAEEIKIGIILGFTGPIESMTPGMANSAELALKEVNESGLFLNGQKLVSIRADTTCVDTSIAQAAADRLVTAEKVAAIIGSDCSGASIAIVNNVAMPNGVVMISPASTSPALTTINDNGYFFRTVPSDARQGEVLAQILKERGTSQIAISYANEDYGRGLSDSFTQSFVANGGKVTVAAPHDDGKGDYSAEVGTLAAAGGEMLAVFGRADQGGSGIVQTSLESGAFETFLLGDGMYSRALLEAFGSSLDGSIGVVPWSQGEGADSFERTAKAANFDPDGAFRRESYDAAALIALAMQKAGSADRTAIRDAMLDVANGPGEKILAGELAKGLKILKEGGDIDYVGATNVELIGNGESAGTYREYVIENADYTTIRFH